MKGKVCVVVATLAFLSVLPLGNTQETLCTSSADHDTLNLGVKKMNDTCFKDVLDHVGKELEASITYLKMGAHFLDANYFRPGIAHMFLEHAGEERQHAKGLIDYLLMRGGNLAKLDIQPLKPIQTTWKDMQEALTTAFTIEKNVRDAFTRIIYSCEGGDDSDHSDVDYHISDFLTGNFLEEQHKGVRELAGLLSTLNRLIANTKSKTLAEMEFDQTLSHKG